MASVPFAAPSNPRPSTVVRTWTPMPTGLSVLWVAGSSVADEYDKKFSRVMRMLQMPIAASPRAAHR